MNSTFLTDFENIVLAAFSELNKISEFDASLKIDSNNWSLKEIIGHLIDSAANNHQRFIRLQIDREITFPFYQQEEFVKFNGYHNRNWLEILNFWKLYNVHLLHVIRQIDQNKLENVWFTPNNEKLSLRFIIEDYLTHLKHHLLQIKNRNNPA